MKRPRPPARSLGLILALTLCALGLMPLNAASAAVPGLERVVAVSPSNSVFPKVATASCTGAKKVVGVGGFVSNGGGEVVINEIVPDAALTQVRVTAWEDDTGTAANWSVSAIAICADPLAGLQRVQVDGASTSSNKDLFVGCPAGKKMLGLGAYIEGAEGQVMLDAFEPLPSLVSGYLHGSEDQSGAAGNWFLRAVGICADAIPGLVVTTASSALNSLFRKSADATCPAGKRVLSSGGTFFAGSGSGGAGEVLFESLIPPSAMDRVVVYGTEDGSGASFDWRVYAHAVCATA
jgi:hypothetical protein